MGPHERPNRHQFPNRCAGNFAVMTGVLIGMAGRYGDGFAVEHVVKLVQCLAKTLEHDRSLGGMLNWRELANSECIPALLKN